MVERVLIGLAVVVVVLSTFGALPVAAVGGADIAVALEVADDRADPQVFGVVVSNHGPDQAEFPTLHLDAGGQALVDHTADPMPGSRDDGVGCSSTGKVLSCSWDQLAVGASMEFTVAVAVAAEGQLSAELESAGTPDPNPTANNSDALLLRPATADLAVEAGEPTSAEGFDGAELVEVPVVVGNVAGRPVHAVLTVSAEVEVDVELDPACEPDRDGSVACPLGVMASGDRTSVTLSTARPEPGDGPAEITLSVAAAELPDPDPDNNVDVVVIDPRAVVPADVHRHEGAERMRTAVAVSRALFPDGARAAVLARADHFADALAGAPLAVAADAPILLTATDQLPDVTAEELQRLLRSGGHVHLLGGEAAIGPAVADAVAALGHDVRRFAGANRYETSAVIAEALGGPDEIAYADGDTFADAVVAAAAMAGRGGALLLTSGSRLPDETAGMARQADWSVGRGAARAVPGATELAGTTPAETSVIVAEALFGQPDTIAVATDSAFPDALAGGPLTAAIGGPMLLTDPDVLPSSIIGYLTRTDTITGAHLLGGVGAVSANVEAELADLLAR